MQNRFTYVAQVAGREIQYAAAGQGDRTDQGVTGDRKRVLCRHLGDMDGGASQTLLVDLACQGLNLLPISGGEGQGCGAAEYDRVHVPQFCHRQQRVTVNTGDRNIGDCQIGWQNFSEILVPVLSKRQRKRGT